MSKALAHPAVRPLTEPAVYAPPALLAVFLVIVWALTGAGYFWPMWPVFGILLRDGPVPVGSLWPQPAPRRAVVRDAGIALADDLGRPDPDLGDVRLRVLLAGLGDPRLQRPARRSRALRRRPRERSLRGPRRRADPDAQRRPRRAGIGAAADRARPARRRPGAARRAQHAAGTRRGAARRQPGDRGAGAPSAREEATAAIAELRDLARGIAPPVLADRGLEAAVAVAGRPRRRRR